MKTTKKYCVMTAANAGVLLTLGAATLGLASSEVLLVATIQGTAALALAGGLLLAALAAFMNSMNASQNKCFVLFDALMSSISFVFSFVSKQNKQLLS